MSATPGRGTPGPGLVPAKEIENRTEPTIQLCSGILPASASAPCGDACDRPISGVDCRSGNGCGEPHWNAWGPIPWQAFAQGEYVGPARLPHVPEYRLRVDDEIEFIYRLTREELSHRYQLEVGDVDPHRVADRPDAQPRRDRAARRHRRSAADRPGPRRSPHGGGDPRRPERALQKVLQGHRHQRHAHQDADPARRPAGRGR